MLGLIIGAAIGAAVGGFIAYKTAQNQGAEGWDLFSWTLAGVVGGGIVGAAIGAGVGAIATQATGILGFSITKGSIMSIKSVTLLGNMPSYTNFAGNVGAGYYHISRNLLKGASNVYQWTKNLQYIKDAVSLGSQFVLAPDKVVGSGTILWLEIQYLIENGIPWTMC